MSLRPSLASPRARELRQPKQNRQFAPQPPTKQKTKITGGRQKTRILDIKSQKKKGISDGVDLDAILASAKSGSIAHSALPAGQFAWDMSSPVADQRRILRQRELEDSRIEQKQDNDPLSPPKRIRIPDAIPTVAMATATDQLFNCSPMPSPQNSPRQGTMRASPVRTLSIDLDMKMSFDGSATNPNQKVTSPTSRTTSPRSPPRSTPRSPLASASSPQSPRSPLAQSPNAKHGRNPTLEPAVMVGFVRDRQGSPPRRIAVERKRVEYESQSLPDLLSNAGVDVELMISDIERKNDGLSLEDDEQYMTGPTTSASQGGLSKNLPLEIFDNVDFEMYTPEEWMVRVSCLVYIYIYIYSMEAVELGDSISLSVHCAWIANCCLLFVYFHFFSIHREWRKKPMPLLSQHVLCYPPLALLSGTHVKRQATIP